MPNQNPAQTPSQPSELSIARAHPFWHALERSIIVQSTITLLLVASVVYLALASKPVPDLLANLTLMVVSFWMGTKVEYRARDLAREAR